MNIEIEPFKMGTDYKELCETIEGFQEDIDRINKIDNKTIPYKPFSFIKNNKGI